MANWWQVQRLKRGVNGWNRWRERNSEVFPELGGARLKHANLGGANLSNADLSGAHLHYADLSGADLSNALQLHL